MGYLLDTNIVTAILKHRGFASWEFIEEMSKTQTKFVVRIKNNMKTQFNPQRYRVVCFHDPET
ncbi:MAG: hypothetical protein J7545_09305, partial [Roseofilum sp. SBFL]|nr:hypothetical protein [Roseofilum sp. SID3]MBP0022708.1 hypothetical protein [Roseofilum sp. SID2]MBP0037148.1 hypothetical protein [Roseofilum sp. SID1]MBP0042156.1 hypothetical protein [Roseofilum sp. SBFL]